MKMEMDASTPEQMKEKDPSPSAIGTEFARQYYTLLATSPSNVHRFYSHESMLLLNDKQVVGQQNIGLAIEELVGEGSRFRIVSINGLNTCNQGIALQVFGEMTGRRFVQTFILGQQGAKKYYVQTDLFQFVDAAFKGSSETSPEPPCEPTKPVTPPPAVPISRSVANTYNSVVDNEVPKEPEPLPSKPSAKKVEARPHNESHVSAEKKKTTPRKEREVKEPVRKEEQTENIPSAPVERAPTPVEQDSTPKTWAKLVGGGSSSKTTVAAPTSQINVQKPAPTKVPTKQVNGSAPQPAKSPVVNGERRIYLGSIVRNVVPESTSDAERQIRDAFSKHGEVDNVAMPRKVLDQPTDHARFAYAFITMKTAADAQSVFSASKKDEKGYLFSIKIDSFGFDGEVNISEQKDRPERPTTGGFRGRGGFSSGGARGGFAHRGRGNFKGGVRSGGGNQN